MDHLTRRAFGKSALTTLVTTGLLELLYQQDAFAASVKPITEKWLREVTEICADLKTDKVTQHIWQEQMHKLLGQVELAELMRLIDFEKLEAKARYRDKGEVSQRVQFPKIEGLPDDLPYGKQVFNAKKGRSVVPHGHNNMATLFLVLKGEWHGRHYDRLEDESEYMIIKPTIDQNFKPGEFSTISDFKDNVHWFKCLSETGFLFNMHLQALPSGPRKSGGRVYVDPDGEKLAQGHIRAPLMRAADAYEKYG